MSVSGTDRNGKCSGEVYNMVLNGSNKTEY